MPQPPNPASEIVAVFHSTEALEHAISELASAGWDRAEMSLLGAPDLIAQVHPANAPQSPVISKDDVRQMRTLTSGMAGVAAAFVAAGATIMSGGAALAAIVGAAAAGGGAAAVLEGFGHSADEKREEALRKQIDAGGILLWALLRDDRDEPKAREILQRTGATDIEVRTLTAPHRDKVMPLH